jgi:hypothetical protein
LKTSFVKDKKIKRFLIIIMSQSIRRAWKR